MSLELLSWEQQDLIEITNCNYQRFWQAYAIFLARVQKEGKAKDKLYLS